MMKASLLILSLLPLAHQIQCDCQDDNKVIFNFIFSKQIIALENQFRLYNKTYINLNKEKFDISDDIKADGVRIFDITKLVPGDTYLWTAPNNLEYAEIRLGMDPMSIKVNTFKYKGKTYDNAEIEVSKAFLNTKQTTVFKRDSCKQSYSDFSFDPIEKATLNGDQDITDDVNKIVVPWVNEQIQTKDFQNLVDEYFDSICDPQSALRLLKLITTPYSN